MSTEILTPEVEVLDLDNTINQSLVKANVTDAIIEKLKEQYGNLRLTSIDNKEEYLEIVEAKKQVRKIGILVEKITKNGREEAIAIQKKWLSKEKEILAKISEVQDPLDAEIEKFDGEVKRKEAEEKERQEMTYINRQASLTKMGAIYEDGCFVLGSASVEAIMAKGTDEEIWNETILPKFVAEYNKIEEIKIKEQQKKDEEAAELKRQQDLLLEQQAEVKRRMDEVQKLWDEAEMLKKNKQAAIENENREEQNKINIRRNVELAKYIVFIRDYNKMLLLTEEDYQKELADIKVGAELQWEKDRVEQSAKQEAEKEKAILDAIIAEKQNQAKLKADKEEAERLEVIRKQELLDAAGDKAKWAAFIGELDSIKEYTMKSGYFRKKMAMAIEKLQEIKEI